MTLSDELKRRYASGGDGVAEDGVAQTLEFRHPTMSPVYVTNQPVGFTALLEDGETQVIYQPLGFGIRKPVRDVDARGEFRIQVVNVGRELSDRLEGAIADPRNPPEVVYREYLLSQIEAGPNAEPQEVPPPLVQAPTVAVDDAFATLAPRVISLDRRWQQLYLPELFPGLVR